MQVAALAGIPKNVLRQARHQLSKLEKADNESPQLGLFTTYEEPEPELEPELVLADSMDLGLDGCLFHSFIAPIRLVINVSYI